MQKIRFTQDEGTAFYNTLIQRVKAHFDSNNLSTWGSRKKQKGE
jgi:hypothetical protein